jgi:type II secretory pathway pseudopilin PulG
MALVMAMIVIVLVTLLVAGAISFTGVERSAARLQTNEDNMSACIHAARNLFLGRLRVLLGNAQAIQFEQPLQPENDSGQLLAASGHFAGSPPEIVSVEWVEPNSVGESRAGAMDMSNKVGTAALVANYYRVTAVCRERFRNSAGDPWQVGAEREVEFIVRVGL